MKAIGYVNKTKDVEHYEECYNAMKSLGCEIVYQDDERDSGERPFWKFILGELCDEDTLVLYKLSNALRDCIELCALMKVVLDKNIRLVSLQDCIDTRGLLFHTTPDDYVKMLSDFPRESRLSHSYPITSFKKPRTVERLRNKRKKQKLCCDIMNMYIAGYPSARIAELTGLSRGTVYRTLKRFGIKTDRLHKYDK